MTKDRRMSSKFRCCRIGIWMTAVAVAIGSTAAAQDADGLAAALAIEQAFVRAIAEAETSIVAVARIKVSNEIVPPEPFNPFGIDPRKRFPSSNTSDPSSPDFIPNEFGAGIIIAPNNSKTERLVLTNFHLVQGGPVVGDKQATGQNRLYVRLPDRRGFDARILAADPRSDLAVLKLDLEPLGARASELKPIKLGDATDIRKGHQVLVLGNPYAIARDGSASVSRGMISNISRFPAPAGPKDDPETLNKETIHRFGTLLQVDARLNLGTSGGALLNLRGELIGITTSLAALDGYEKSVGYAVPVDGATRKIIDALSRGFEVEYGFLGIHPVDVSAFEMRQYSANLNQFAAAKARRVFKHSPADSGGLVSSDVILQVNGRPVYGRYDLMREIGLLGPGTTAQLRVWRESARRRLNLAVTLGKWPVLDDDGIVATKQRFATWRGMTVDFPTSRKRFIQSPSFEYSRAVVVLSVDAKSRADLAQLRPGDFITHVEKVAVQSPSDFYNAIKDRANEVTLRLLDGRDVLVRK